MQRELEDRRDRERARRQAEERRRFDERLDGAVRVAARALDRLQTDTRALDDDGLGSAALSAALSGAVAGIEARRRVLEARLSGATDEERALLVATEAGRLRDDLRLLERSARAALDEDGVEDPRQPDRSRAAAELERLLRDAAAAAGPLGGLLEPGVAEQVGRTFEVLRRAVVDADGKTPRDQARHARRVATAYLRQVGERRTERLMERDRACCALRRLEDRLTATEVDAAARRWAVDDTAALWERARSLRKPLSVGAFAEVCEEVARLDGRLERMLADAEDRELAFWRSQTVESALLAAMAEESLVCEVMSTPAPGGARVVLARGFGGGSIRATVEAGGSLTYEVFGDDARPSEPRGSEPGGSESRGSEPRGSETRERLGAVHRRLTAKGVRTGPLQWECENPD